jgi:hypothetical protein
MRIKIMILVLLVVGFAVVGFISFSGTTPESSVINQDQFVEAYVSLATLAEKMAIGTPEYEREKARILKDIGIEPSDVEEALAYYNERPEQWRPIWEKIQDKLGEPVPAQESGTSEAEAKPDSM